MKKVLVENEIFEYRCPQREADVVTMVICPLCLFPYSTLVVSPTNHSPTD